MKIQITIGDQRFEAALMTAPQRVTSLAAAGDRSHDRPRRGREDHLPAPLAEGRTRGRRPRVGDLATTLRNDLVLYCGDQSYYPGIVILGRLDSDAAEQIAGMDGRSRQP